MHLKIHWNNFLRRNKYSVCCLLSTFASLLGIVNPILSSYIASNILNHFNLAGIIPSLVSMAAVKGLRIFLRSRVTLTLKGNMRAPYSWLQSKIGKKLWWVEPMVESWGWAGLVMTRLTGGVSAQTAAFITSTLTDTLNTLASGIVYYFTQNYVLSVLTALILPAFAVAPWFAGKAFRIHHYSRHAGAH